MPVKHTGRNCKLLRRRFEWIAIYYLWNGSKRRYVPDFIVEAASGGFLVLELKGQKSQQNDAKHAALEEWVAAVNEEKRFGDWSWALAYAPHEVDDLIAGL